MRSCNDIPNEMFFFQKKNNYKHEVKNLGGVVRGYLPLLFSKYYFDAAKNSGIKDLGR